MQKDNRFPPLARPAPAPKLVKKEPMCEIVGGQIWRVIDKRFSSAPPVKIINIGPLYRRPFPNNTVADVRDIEIENTVSGRRTTARSDRFNGSGGGYVFVGNGS